MRAASVGTTSPGKRVLDIWRWTARSPKQGTESSAWQCGGWTCGSAVAIVPHSKHAQAHERMGFPQGGVWHHDRPPNVNSVQGFPSSSALTSCRQLWLLRRSVACWRSILTTAEARRSKKLGRSSRDRHTQADQNKAGALSLGRHTEGSEHYLSSGWALGPGWVYPLSRRCG